MKSKKKMAAYVIGRAFELFPLSAVINDRYFSVIRSKWPRVEFIPYLYQNNAVIVEEFQKGIQGVPYKL